MVRLMCEIGIRYSQISIVYVELRERAHRDPDKEDGRARQVCIMNSSKHVVLCRRNVTCRD